MNGRGRNCFRFQPVDATHWANRSAISGHSPTAGERLLSGGQSLCLPDSDNRHFGFAVESKQAVDEVARKARADACLFWEPDEYIPGAYLCAAKDPNGNCVEFSFGHSMPPP